MTITIDPKCTNPLECRICLDRCPEKVFGTNPRIQRAPGIAASSWVIVPLFASLCTECLECVSFCPIQAIAISAD